MKLSMPPWPLRQVRAVDLVDAVGNPIHDQRLGAGIPQRAVDAIILRVNDVEPVGGRRRLHFHTERFRFFDLTVVAGQFQNIFARRGKGRGRHRRTGIGKRDRARTGFLAPAGDRRLRLAFVLDRTAQVSFAADHHVAIDAGDDDRGEVGRVARVINFPLQNSGRAVGRFVIVFEAKPVALHFGETGRVVFVRLRAEAGGVFDGNELRAVPGPATGIRPARPPLRRADRRRRSANTHRRLSC